MDRRAFVTSLAALTAIVAGGRRVLAKPSALAGSWPGRYQPAPPLPQPLQEIYPARFDNHLVIAGGFSSIGPLPYPVASSHWFDLSEQLWRPGPDLPHRLHHPYLVAHRGQLWSLGGYRFSYLNPWQMQSSCSVLDAVDDQWQMAVPLPGRRAEFAAGSTDLGLIVTAGRKPMDDSANGQYEDHTNAAETWLWDGDRWLSGAPIPTPRNSVGTAVVANRLHVIAGRSVVQSGVQKNRTEHQVYDPQADSWEGRAPLPVPQAGCAAAAFDDAIYLFGGEVFTEPKRVFANAWRYDLQADQWQALPDMLIPVHGHGAVSGAEGIHLLGGGEEVSAGKTSAQHTLFVPAGFAADKAV